MLSQIRSYEISIIGESGTRSSRKISKQECVCTVKFDEGAMHNYALSEFSSYIGILFQIKKDSGLRRLVAVAIKRLKQVM